MPRMVVWTDLYVKPLSRGGVRGVVLAIGENVQRSQDAGKFYVTITGVGVPLKPHVMVRASGGTDSRGHAIICQRAE